MLSTPVMTTMAMTTTIVIVNEKKTINLAMAGAKVDNESNNNDDGDVDGDNKCDDNEGDDVDYDNDDDGINGDNCNDNSGNGYVR